MEFLKKKLLQREKEGNLRSLSLSSGKIDFLSNDYLGLAQNEELANLIVEESVGLSGRMNGSGGSRLLSGNSDRVEALECKLARFFHTPAFLLFNSGYNANLSILASVAGRLDTILCDELIHASLIDGARLSLARKYSFRHNDLTDLERLLQGAQGEKFVITEALFSMDGDFAPLGEIVQLCEVYKAHLIVDESHSTGIFGKNGQGLSVELGLEERLFARIHTFGKALGVHGAGIAGSEVLKQFLINFARPFIYTTALPPHSLLSIDKAIDFRIQHPDACTDLFENISLYKAKNQYYKDVLCLASRNQSPIQTLKVAGNEQVRELALHLQSKGFEVRPIFSPTVKAGEERIRICLHSFNSSEEITRLTEETVDYFMVNKLL